MYATISARMVFSDGNEGGGAPCGEQKLPTNQYEKTHDREVEGCTGTSGGDWGHGLSGPLRLRVQSRLRVEGAVENRGLFHVFVLRLFYRGFRHYSATIARLSPDSIAQPVEGATKGMDNIRIFLAFAGSMRLRNPTQVGKPGWGGVRASSTLLDPVPALCRRLYVSFGF